jgi:hypothetical protein
MPDPNATRMRLVAAAVIAPAKMAGHEAADTGDSFGRVATSGMPPAGPFALISDAPVAYAATMPVTE